MKDIYSNSYISYMKIIQIGLNKAATTSLWEAFRILGYNALHDNESATTLITKALFEQKKILHYIDEFDAYFDNPFLKPEVFTKIDRDYPNCKFIFLTREIQEYCQRVTKLIMVRKAKNIIINKILNDKTEEEILQECKSGYIRRHSFTKSYFKYRSKDILWMNICNKGDGWNKLSNFLNIETPDKPFPHIKPITTE